MNEESETENQQENIAQTYRRAGIGLALAAIGWTLALLFANDQDERPARWVIPIAAAAISVGCFTLSTRTKQKE